MRTSACVTKSVRAPLCSSCRFYDVDKSVDELKSLPPRDVEESFYPPASHRRRKIPPPDWEQIYSRILYLGKHADLSLLLIQYKKEVDGYQLTRFYKLYGDYLESIGEASSASMPVNRIPEQCLYLDWAGDQLEVFLNHDTGEIERVHLFVATMGFSSRLYVETFLNEKTASFVSGTVNSLADMGALPERLVPDNDKEAIKNTTSKKGETLLA